MATSPQGQSCFSFLHDCDGDDQSTRAASFHQGRSQHHQPDHHSEVMKETEDLLAAEMNKLSVKERSMALNDVHCVGEVMKETPELIEQSLREFDEIVQTITDNRIYNIALNQNRSYVEATSFRLKFLRKNLFDVRKSVNNMMNFLQYKALYFGEEKVAQDIVPEDMNEEEIALMRTGFFQILKDRDQSGRLILYTSPVGRVNFAECKIETWVHVVYHIIFNIIISTESAQKNGIVMIHYDESKGKTEQFPPFSFLTKAHMFFETLPLRLSSFHICFYSAPGSLALYNKIGQMVLKALPEHTVTRTRIHYGSDMERQYLLQTFGIPLDNFPVDRNGNIRTEIQNAWRDNKYLENVSSNVDEHQARSRRENEIPHVATSEILQTDVLFGRGRPVYHFGNSRYREFLDAHAEVYESIPRHRKKRACIGYTQELISSGARFLRQTETDDDLWVVCDFDQVVDKGIQYFRTRRRMMNKRRRREAGLNS